MTRRSCGTSALLVIDPQRAFTSGVWMRSIGPDGARDVVPLRRAFEACARRLSALPAASPRMLTRCPFPPGSYDWDPVVGEVLPADQPYFVKPGNSVLWPPTNGFREWVGELVAAGIGELVIGGCTLNSCVRVSAVEAQRLFGAEGLQIVVDLDLCGARAANYKPAALFGGRSPVEAAIDEMREAGVRVDGEAIRDPSHSSR